jgi:hypothetical protein
MSIKFFLHTLFITSLALCILQLSIATHTEAATSALEIAKAAASANGAFNDAVKDEKPAAAPKLSPQQVSGGSAAAIAPFAKIKVEKAVEDNAYTVQEIFSKHKELVRKIVQVRGKVVKYNSEIMGRNWIHIQDGSGDPLQNTHDLVATSTEQAAVGDIITVQGTLTTNQDFGAGYTYIAMITEAEIKK